MNTVQILTNGIGGGDFALTVSRIALGSFFALSGYHKLFNPSRHRALIETLKSCGVPFVSVCCWLVPSVEFLGGLGVTFGFLTPLAALGLLAVISVAILTDAPKRVAGYAPIDFGDRVDDYLYLPEVWYAIVLLLIVAHGGGPFSIDGYIHFWGF